METVLIHRANPSIRISNSDEVIGCHNQDDHNNGGEAKQRRIDCTSSLSSINSIVKMKETNANTKSRNRALESLSKLNDSGEREVEEGLNQEENTSIDWKQLSRNDSIGSFHSHTLKEQRNIFEMNSSVTEKMKQLVQRFVKRTERFKEKTVQPPTPSSASLDVASVVSDPSDPDQIGSAGRRLNSFVPIGSSASGSLEHDALQRTVECGRCHFKIPRLLYKLRPQQCIDYSSNFYLTWLFVISLAFIYNGVAGPLRTAFRPAPIYSLNANLFPIFTLPTQALPYSENTSLDQLSTLNTTIIPSKFNSFYNPRLDSYHEMQDYSNGSLISGDYSENHLFLLHHHDYHHENNFSSFTYYDENNTNSQNTIPFSPPNLTLSSLTTLANVTAHYFTEPYTALLNSNEPVNNSTDPIIIFTEPVENSTDFETTSSLFKWFPGYETEENRIYWWIADYICDMLYILDIILVKSRVNFLKNGILETNSKEALHNYMSKINFKLDLLSLLPLDLLYLIPAINYNSLVRLPRLLKIQTFWEFYDLLDKRVSSAYVVRVARILSYMMYLIHLETCGLFAMSAYIGIGSDGWVWSGTGHAYIQCMYFATKTATNIGNNVQPNTQLEYMFMTCYWLAGIFVFAMLIGQIRDIFQAADANSDRYRKTISQTMYYMKSMNVPKELQNRVKLWFTYNWQYSKTLDENSLLEALPKKMRTDLAIHVHFNTLSKVNLFQDCDKNLLYDLVLKLKPVLYLPGDYICRKGEVGTEMYIVMMGHVEVVGGPNNVIVFATLKEGSVFGEISLLALAGGNRRTADVRSKGYSQLFLLSKADFEEAMCDYPEAQKILRKKAKKLLSQNAKQQSKELKTEVEEVIRSRHGTPKLLKTVIKVINEDSHIPDYLRVRRKSSNKPWIEDIQMKNRQGNENSRKKSISLEVGKANKGIEESEDAINNGKSKRSTILNKTTEPVIKSDQREEINLTRMNTFTEQDFALECHPVIDIRISHCAENSQMVIAATQHTEIVSMTAYDQVS